MVNYFHGITTVITVVITIRQEVNVHHCLCVLSDVILLQLDFVFVCFVLFLTDNLKKT